VLVQKQDLRISLAATEDSSGAVRGASSLGTLLKNLLHQSLKGILHFQVLLRLQETITVNIVSKKPKMVWK